VEEAANDPPHFHYLNKTILNIDPPYTTDIKNWLDLVSMDRI